jgi:hypothetical protein
MLVIWDPEDGSDKQTWHFDADDVPRKRAAEIEKLYRDGGGSNWDGWKLGLQAGEILPRTILLWYMLTGVHPKLQFRDLPDFRVRQLKVEQTVAELKALWKQVQRMGLDEDKAADMEKAFRISLEDAAEREGLDIDITFDEGQLAIEGEVVSTTDPKGL